MKIWQSDNKDFEYKINKYVYKICVAKWIKKNSSFKSLYEDIYSIEKSSVKKKDKITLELEQYQDKNGSFFNSVISIFLSMKLIP